MAKKKEEEEEEEEGNGYPLQYSCQENIGKGSLVGHKSIGVVKGLDTTNQLTLWERKPSELICI